jgi:hypothetical protein
MSHYDTRPDDLVQDTKQFLESEYGKYVVSTLEEMQSGNLTNTADIKAEHPERWAARYSAVKEVLELIKSPVS